MGRVAGDDRRAIFGWAMYDWANSAYITVAGTVVATFFTGEMVPEEGYLGMSGETLWAAVVSVGSVVLFLGMPVLGAVADYTASKRAFLRFFALLGAGFTMVVPFVPSGEVLWFLGLFLVTQVGFVAANVFYDGFLPELTDDRTIDRVSAKGFALGYVGGGVYLVVALAIILLSGDGGVTRLTETGAARVAIFGAGVWWTVFMWYSLRRLPETGRADGALRAPVGGSRTVGYARVGFGRTWTTARRLAGFPQLLLFVLAFLFYNDGTQTVIAVSGAYAEDTLGFSTEQVIVAFLVVQLTAFLGALAFGVLADRIGTKGAIMTSLAGWSVVAVAGALLPEEAVIPLLGLAAVIGVVLGGIQALSRSLYGSMIPEEASAEFYGFFSVFSKFSAIWGPLVFAVVSGITGSGRPAIMSMAVFFLVGMAILSRVDVAAARLARRRWRFRGAEAETAATDRVPGG